MKLFKQDGSQVEVPDDQAADALASGQYGLPKGTKIPWSQDGQVGTLDFDPSTFAQVHQGGGQVVPAATVAKAEKDAYLQQNYGSAGDMAAAAALGFADTATLGAAPAVAGALGGKDARRYMRNVEEANPISAGAGSAAGLVAPIAADILTAGAATPELAAAGARTAAKLGVEGAEAARLAEAGASAAPKLAEALPTVGATPKALAGSADALKTGLASPQAIRGAAPTVEADVLKTAAQSPGAKAFEAAEGVAKAAETSGTVEASGVKKAAEAAKAGVEAAKPVARAAADSAVERAVASEPGLLNRAVKLGAEGVAAPSRLVAEVGSLVEREVQNLIGTEAESLLGRVAQKTVALGARGAAEGAIYEAGSELSHESKQDNPNFTAEKFLSALWRGGKFGALAGGAFGGGASLIGEGVRRAAPALLDQANSLMFTALDKSGGLRSEFEGKFGKEAASSLREQLIDSGVMTAGARVDEMAPKLADQARMARAQWLEKGLQAVEGKGLYGPTMKEVEAAVRKELPKSRLSSIEGSPGLNPDRVVEDFRKFSDGTGLTFEGTAKLVNELDMAIQAAPAAQKAGLVKVQDFLTSHLEGSLSKAMDGSKDLGEFFGHAGSAAQLDAARLAAERYQQLAMASRYADQAAGAFTKDAEKAALASAEKGITGLPKGLESAAAQFAAGSLLGHGVGAVALGFAGKAAKKIASERGHSAAAVALDEVALRAGAAEAGDQVQRRIDRAVAGIFSKEAQGTYGMIPEPVSRLSYDERVDRLLKAAETAEESTQSIIRDYNRAGLRDERVAQAVTSGYLKTVNYLLGEIPKPPQDPYSVQPDLRDRQWEPSEGAKQDFARKYDVVTHPEHYVRRVADGTVTPSETKALLATNPEIHDYAVKAMKKKAAKEKKVVLPTTEASIRRAEGVPLISPTTRSAFSRVDRELGQLGHQGGGRGGPRSPLKVDPGAVGLTGRGKASKY